MKTSKQVIRHAFSLLEIIIAIGILTILLFVCYQLTVFTNNVRETNKRVVNELQVEHNILALISEDLENCQWISDRHPNILIVEDDPNNTGVHSIDMVSYFKKINAETKKVTWLNEVAYRLSQNSNDDYYSLLRRTDSGFDRPRNKGGHWSLVHDQIAGLNFRCYDGKEWQEAWNSKKEKSMPQAIEIILTLPPNNKDNNEDQDLIQKRRFVLYEHPIKFKLKIPEEGDDSDSPSHNPSSNNNGDGK